jgi:hypothetical protein
VHPGLLLLVVMAATPADRAPLRLRFEQCPDIDQATVRRVVTVELEAGLADERQEGPVTTAKAECTEGGVRLTVDDPVTGKTTTRSLDMERQSKNLRSRLLGLAISEAVLASWVELRLTPAFPIFRPGLSSWTEFHQQASAITERRLPMATVPTTTHREVAVGPSLRAFSSGLRVLGAAVLVRRWIESQRVTGLGMEIEVSHGERSVVNVASGDATSFSMAPCLLMASRFDSVTVSASIGGRIGLARLSADPSSILRTGRTAWRGWGGPFLAGDITMLLPADLLVRIGVESGYALVPARGGVDSVDAVALDGAWLGAVASVGKKL